MDDSAEYLGLLGLLVGLSLQRQNSLLYIDQGPSWLQTVRAEAL